MQLNAMSHGCSPVALSPGQRYRHRLAMLTREQAQQITAKGPEIFDVSRLHRERQRAGSGIRAIRE